jgi:hypothetical protein
MKRGIIITIVIVAVLAGIWLVLKNNKKNNDAKTAIVSEGSGAVSVRTAAVTKQAVDLDFSAN